jgi:DNA-binding MarR family transcriptional regulator
MRCQYLDGRNDPEGKVIAYLRDAGGFIYSGELANDMNMSKEHTLRLLRRLIDGGRVVRIQFDNDGALFCLVDGVRPSMEAKRCFKKKVAQA